MGGPSTINERILNMGKRSFKGKIEGQFTPVLWATMDSPAWTALSHGARSLYVDIKRQVPAGRNRAYLSYRKAYRKLGANSHKIREWFAELVHYGFIVMEKMGCLGVDGKGKSPTWRLTELGQTRATSAEGVFEPGTKDFLKWDGVLFDPKPYRVNRGSYPHKKQNPVVDVHNTPLSTCTTPPLSTCTTPKAESVVAVHNISGEEGVVAVHNITRLATVCSLSAELDREDREGAEKGEDS
jgi:hypothetical protein